MQGPVLNTRRGAPPCERNAKFHAHLRGPTEFREKDATRFGCPLNRRLQELVAHFSRDRMPQCALAMLL
jgi:hypothetical protein